MKRPTFVYLKSADHPQTEEILVKSPRLFGITATISIVVQPLDHPSLSLVAINPYSFALFRCSHNSRPKPVILTQIPCPPFQRRTRSYYTRPCQPAALPGAGINGRRAMNLSRRDLAAAAGVLALVAAGVGGPVLANTEDEAEVK